jgi:hypothetical protein
VRRFSGILPFKAKVSFNKAGEKKIRTNKNQEITKLNKFHRYEGHSEVKKKKSRITFRGSGLPSATGTSGCPAISHYPFQNYPRIILLVYLHTNKYKLKYIMHYKRTILDMLSLKLFPNTTFPLYWKVKTRNSRLSLSSNKCIKDNAMCTICF